MSTITYLPITSTQISTDSGTPVKFSITNNSDEHLTLYWVDRTGKLVSYNGLDKGQSLMQDTISSHVWELASADGKVAFKFTPDFAGNITINADYSKTFSDFSEKVMQTSGGLWSTAQGYGLIDAAASLGVAVTADLPLSGQNNNAALNVMHAASAWAAGFTGKGVKVAVIDIGIAASAEINSRIVDGYDFYQKDSDPTPDAGTYKDHALGVASIIAASHDAHSGRDTMGVAPDASLINVRVGSSQYGSSSADMASGIRFAVDHGAKVICMPLESPTTQLDQQVADAVHYAYTHNVVTVIIGGNYSSYGATGPALIAQQLKGEAIDVGNYNVLAGAPFDSSNMPGNNPFPWVMASSSGYVPNSVGGYSYWNDGGTSFAGPYVAGLAALLWQQNPNATASQIINKITAGAHLGETQALADFKSGLAGHAGADRIQLGSTVLALDVGKGQAAGEAYRLYQAAFDRKPDAGGLSFWLSAIDKGQPLTDVANEFIKSAEFKNLYGDHPTNEQFLNALYHNVLHRDADAGGLAFWLDGMNHGVSQASALAQFSESAENVAQVAQIIGQGFEYTPYA